jgi:hypothetical protein
LSTDNTPPLRKRPGFGPTENCGRNYTGYVRKNDRPYFKKVTVEINLNYKSTSLYNQTFTSTLALSYSTEPHIQQL